MASKLRKTSDRPLQSARVIICEGSDEFDILGWIRAQRGLSEDDIEILDAKGRSNLSTLLGDLRYLSGGSDVELVVVVLDAEERSGADQALLQRLGAIAQDQGFGYLPHVLPNPESAGALETLVRMHVDADAPASTCADAWEACLSPAVAARTKAQQDKAWGHVWLAGQGAFHSRLGHALANNAGVRDRLPAVIQHFEKLLDHVLGIPLK